MPMAKVDEIQAYFSLRLKKYCFLRLCYWQNANMHFCYCMV